MRTLEDYKKLIKGFSFCFLLLKKIDSKAYERFMTARELLNNDHSRFAELVRDLKVDFINENDDSDGDAQVFTRKNFLNDEYYGVSYAPKDGYELGLLFMKQSLLGSKKMFYDISSTTIDDLKDGAIDLFGITTLDEEAGIDKSFVYVGKIKEDNLIIYEVNLDNPDVYVRDFKFKLSEIKETEEEIIAMF